MGELEFSTQVINQIDDLLIDTMIRTKAPGLSIGVVLGDKLIFSRNYGAKDLEKSEETTSDTIYAMGSLAKTFTSSAIFKLIEQGKLSLEDPISDYLPINLGFNDDPIRIKHLMSHTSGIPDLTGVALENHENLIGSSTEIPKVPFTSLDDFYRYINGAKEFISDHPGKRFYYNNFGYELLVRIVEKVSRSPFKDFVKSEIFLPLEMKSSIYNEETQNPNLAIRYIMDLTSKVGKIIPTKFYPNKKFVSGAGGIFSSINDMANYIIMHLNGGKFRDKQIFTDEHISMMQTKQVINKYPNLPFSSFYGDHGESGYGFGLAVADDFFGHKLVIHSGDFIGGSSFLAMIPEKKLGLIMLSNMTPSPTMFGQLVLMPLLGINPYEHPMLKLQNHQKMLCGEYHSYKNVKSVKITSMSGELFLEENPSIPKRQLVPWDLENNDSTLNYYITRSIGGKLAVQFEKDNNGTFWLHYERDKLKKS